MRKILYTIFFVIAVFSAAMAYLKLITLPYTAREFAVIEIEKATGKKAFIQSVRFSIFKGIVLDGPVLYDTGSVVIRAKEISCGLFLPSILKKEILVPEIKIESPSIFLERRPDRTLNVTELISEEYISKQDMALVIYKIAVRNGTIDFIDRTLDEPFVKTIEDVDIDIRPSLPAKIRFNINCKIPSEVPGVFKASGEYLIPQKESNVEVILDNLSMKEFASYYEDTGYSFPDGEADLKITLRLKDGMADADINAVTKKLSVYKDNVESTIDSDINAKARIDFDKNVVKYSGNIDVRKMDISGLDTAGRLENISGKAEFDESHLSSDDANVTLFGLPWKARINIVNFANPILDIYAGTRQDLAVLKKLAADNFNINFPADVGGEGEVSFSIQMEEEKPMKVNGRLRLYDGSITIGAKDRIENLNGDTRFTSNNLTWDNLDFTCRGAAYKTSGVLTNFSSPGIRLQVTSKDLSFESIAAVNDKTIILTQLKGKYFNSDFSATGRIITEGAGRLGSAISGTLDIDLKDMERVVKDSESVKKMKPSGRLTADFAVEGDLKDVKKCNIDIMVKNGRAVLYGLELTDLYMDYRQRDGSGQIRTLRSMFYGGSMSATGKIEWPAKRQPYVLSVNAKDVKLERLRKDTGIKDKDVAGDIKLYASLSGFLKDVSETSGLGKIAITNGKLWQLDLFKGLGALIFTSDFNYIVFAEGSCDFKIKDKVISTNDFVLKSDLIKLYGSGRVGFDKSVAASLKSELDEEAMYPGFRKNIASAIGKYTFIEVSGNVTNPKYTIKPSVSGIVEDLTNRFLQE